MYFKTVIVDYVANWDERDRYQNMLVLRCKDGKNHGKMSRQDDFKLAAPSFAVARHQESREVNDFYSDPSTNSSDQTLNGEV